MFQSLGFKIVYTVLMFLATLVLSNLALPGNFGIISLLILNASLFSLVTGLGADTMIMHMLGNHKWSVEEAVYFMWRTVGIQLLLFTLLEAGCFAVTGWSLLSYEKGTYYFFLDLFYFIGLVLTEKFIALLYSVHKARKANLWLSAVALMYFLLLIVIYYLFRVSILTLLYLFAFQSLLQGVVLMVIFFSEHKVKGMALKNKKLTDYFKVSAIVMVTNIIQLLAYRVDYWLLKAFYSNYEVGIYSQSNKFANLVWLIPNMVTQLLVPKFMTFDKEDVSKIFKTAFYSNLVIVGGTILFANVIFFFFLDPAYRPGLSAFYLMLPGYFFWAAVIYFAGYFSWQGKFRYNLIGSIGCFIIILIADLLLIPTYSFKGAAIANSIAYTAIFILYLVMMSRMSKFRLQQIFLPSVNDFKRTISILK